MIISSVMFELKHVVSVIRVDEEWGLEIGRLFAANQVVEVGAASTHQMVNTFTSPASEIMIDFAPEHSWNDKIVINILKCIRF